MPKPGRSRRSRGGRGRARSPRRVARPAARRSSFAPRIRSRARAGARGSRTLAEIALPESGSPRVQAVPGKSGGGRSPSRCRSRLPNGARTRLPRGRLPTGPGDSRRRAGRHRREAEVRARRRARRPTAPRPFPSCETHDDGSRRLGYVRRSVGRVSVDNDDLCGGELLVERGDRLSDPLRLVARRDQDRGRARRARISRHSPPRAQARSAAPPVRRRVLQP